jgi:integrase
MAKKNTTAFPLWLHKGSSQWAKTVRGKRYYFGADRDEALQRWLNEKDDLLAGRAVSSRGAGLTVGDAANYYLHQQRRRVETNELKERTWNDYRTTCERVVAHFGRETSVNTLTPDRLAAFRSKLAQGRGATALGREIQQTRGLFKWIYDDGLIDVPVRFGRGFAKPDKKARKAERNSREPRWLEAEEIRGVLEAAGPQLRAMTLLGVNAGCGNTDVSELRRRHIKGDWLDYPRPKTHELRRCPLWPETVEAIAAARKVRPKTRQKEDADRVFLTQQGNPWMKHPGSALTSAFKKLLVSVGADRHGVSFYSLRHVFQTIGEETGDLPAVARIMGHADQKVAGHYREWRKDAREAERLSRVTEHVHGWLWPPTGDGDGDGDGDAGH